MLVFPDIEVETRNYLLEVLGPRWPGLRVVPEDPGVDWQTDTPTMLVYTFTGTGARTGVVYERTLLGFDVYAPTHSQASRLARELRAVLEDWPNRSGLVAGFSDNARPARTSLEDVAYPAYWYAANLQFKATTTTL